MWVKLPTEKNNRSREETNTSSINIQWNLDITIQCTMKPLVEQTNDFLHPFNRLNNIKLYENNHDKKKLKIKMNKFCQSLLYYVYYQGFTVILLG